MKQLQQYHALPLVVPFVLYLVGSAWLAKFPTNWYWLGYACVATTSFLALVLLLSTNQREKLFRVHANIGIGIAIGIAGIVLWIGFSHLRLEQHVAGYLPSWLQPGERAGFNPWDQLEGRLAIGAFLGVRIIGIAVVVPLVEELFWRGFLLRWSIDPDWENVSLGYFTWRSCFTVTALFTLAHPEWLAAASYCLLINGLLYWKKDLWQCIIAHAVSNLLLVFYVLATDNWWLW